MAKQDNSIQGDFYSQHAKIKTTVVRFVKRSFLGEFYSALERIQSNLCGKCL